MVTKVLVWGFLMGALSVAFFHQGMIFLLFHYGDALPEVTAWIGRVAGPGWNLAQAMPNPPLRGAFIPAFVNQMFWGGLWGIAIAAMLRFTRFPDLLGGFLLGLCAVLMAVTVVATLKGLPLFAGGNTQTLLRAALINGGFGWGAAWLMRPFAIRR